VRIGPSLALLLSALTLTPGPAADAVGVPREVPTTAVVWTLDSVTTVGGHKASVAGDPRVVETEIGPAIEFDGVGDGLFLDVNPLQGLERFTIEVIFHPEPGGTEEQRFVHFEEAGTGNRALIELRSIPGTRWTLDTFLRHGQASLTLIDPRLQHTSAEWHVAALTYDGRTMRHYVDGVPEATGEVAFVPLASGRTSIGVRQNKVSWFKGRIRRIRISAAALPATELLRVPIAGRKDAWARGFEGSVPLPQGVCESAVEGRCPLRSAAGRHGAARRRART
jgi:hypothetical protein